MGWGREGTSKTRLELFAPSTPRVGPDPGLWGVSSELSTLEEGGGKGPGSYPARKVGGSLKCLWSHLMTANPIGSQACCAVLRGRVNYTPAGRSGQGGEGKQTWSSLSSSLFCPNCHPSFALPAPKEGEGTQALPHPDGALPSASEAQTKNEGFPPSP